MTTTIDYAEVRRVMPKFKAQLTRAKNSGDPNKVLAACESFFDYFDSRGWSYPDNWHTWNIARRDAEWQLHLDR